MVALSTAFCPPVEYFAVLAGYSSVYIDSSELYNKQSWRNRCRILSANGPLDLMVPVVHLSGRGIKQIRVEYTTPWVAKFERAVASAYYSSPFFEFYRDEFFAILDSHPETLWDLNWQIIEWLCKKIGVAVPSAEGISLFRSSSFGLTPPSFDGPSASIGVPGKREFSGVNSRVARPSEGVPSADELMLDLRDAIHPKRPNTILRDMGLERPYWQVFADRYGFTPGLSVLDMLFNEGPDSILWLK